MRRLDLRPLLLAADGGALVPSPRACGSELGRHGREGLGLHVGGEAIIEPATFTAIVLMVMATTLVTPPALTWAFGRAGRSEG